MKIYIYPTSFSQKKEINPSMREFAELTVCIPTFNPSLEYLELLLKNLNETGTNADFGIRILISDDQSKNIDEIRALAQKYSRVKMIKNEANKGIANNWNNLIENVETSYLLIIGQDDLIFTSNLFKLVSIMQEKNIDTIFCAQSEIDERNYHRQSASKLGRRTLKTNLELFKIPNEYGTFLCICLGNVLPDICSVLINTQFIKKIGKFDNKFRHSPDLDMWIRIFNANSKIYLTNIKVGKKRIHMQSTTTTQVKNRITNHDRHLIYEKYSHLIRTSFEYIVATGRLYVHDLEYETASTQWKNISLENLKYLLRHPAKSFLYLFTSYLLRYTKMEGLVQTSLRRIKVSKR